MNSLTVSDVQEADIVVVSFSVLTNGEIVDGVTANFHFTRALVRLITLMSILSFNREVLCKAGAFCRDQPEFVSKRNYRWPSFHGSVPRKPCGSS